MTIETKYNVGDEVWFMLSNKAAYSKVEKIQIRITVFENTDEKWVEYHLKYPTTSSFEPNQLFPSKQDLLNSL